MFSVFIIIIVQCIICLIYWLSASHNPYMDTINSMMNSNNYDSKLWQYVGTMNNVETYLKPISGSKLLAFRGIVLLDMNISEAMGPYINLTLALQWVSMLKSIKRYPLNNPHSNNNKGMNDDHICKNMDKIISELPLKYQDQCLEYHFGNPNEMDIVHQNFEFPWPISPRDILMQRRFVFDSKEKSVTIHYHSVEDPRIPIRTGVIRSESPFSIWKFKSLDPCITTTSSTTSHDDNDNNNDITSRIDRKDKKIDQFFENIGYKMKKIHQNIKKVFNSNKKDSQNATSLVDDHHSGNSTVGVIGNKSNTRGPKNGGYLALRCTENGKKSTIVLIESFVDSKGSIPAWFINYMQRLWPSQALNAFRKIVMKGNIPPYHRVLNW